MKKKLLIQYFSFIKFSITTVHMYIAINYCFPLEMDSTPISIPYNPINSHSNRIASLPRLIMLGSIDS